MLLFLPVSFTSSFSNCVEELRNSVQVLQYQQEYTATVKKKDVREPVKDLES